MSIVDFLIGRPIPSSDERAEQIGIAKGIPIFGLDALSSAAYGPEAALTLLIPLSVAGLAYIVPLSLSIIALLIIVFFSYRQTIAAYPGGGGSYTVAHQNLGTFPGLLAAAALMIDYVLTAAVGISAGIGALTSAVPVLHSRTLILCLAVARDHHAYQPARRAVNRGRFSWCPPIGFSRASSSLSPSAWARGFVQRRPSRAGVPPRQARRPWQARRARGCY